MKSRPVLQFFIVIFGAILVAYPLYLLTGGLLTPPHKQTNIKKTSSIKGILQIQWNQKPNNLRITNMSGEVFEVSFQKNINKIELPITYADRKEVTLGIQAQWPESALENENHHPKLTLTLETPNSTKHYSTVTISPIDQHLEDILIFHSLSPQ